MMRLKRLPTRPGSWDRCEPVNQIYAGCLVFPGLRVDAHCITYSGAFDDLVAIAQCRNMKEDVDAAVVRRNKANILILPFGICHLKSQ
jgi:hypothetical protein